MLAFKRRWSGVGAVEGTASELEGPQAPGSEPPSPPQRLTGGKRKLSQDYATDADEEVPAPKKRFPGLSSIASSFLGIPFVKNAIKLVTGSADEEQLADDPPSPAPVGDADAGAAPAAAPEPAPAPVDEPPAPDYSTRAGDDADEAPAAVDDDEAAATPAPAAGATSVPLFRPARQKARYSPPVAKPVKAVTRSELKRQLRGRAPVAPRRADAEGAAQPRAAKTPGAASRGARLLTMAHSSAPATLKTPARRAAAALTAPDAPATGGAEEAVEDYVGEPEVGEEPAQPEAAPAEEEAAAAAAAVDNTLQQEEEREEAGAMQTDAIPASPVSGSMMSLAHWAAAASNDDGAASVAAVEEAAAPPEPIAAAVDDIKPEPQQEGATEATPEPEAEPCAAPVEPAEPAEAADGPGEEQQEQLEDLPVSPELVAADIAAAGLTPAGVAAPEGGAVPGSAHQFSALPRLLPRRTASGADSGATSTSCSLLPAGLDGSAPRRAAAAAAPAPAEEGEEAEGGAAVTGLGACAGEDTGRRVRFKGLEEEEGVKGGEAAAAEADAGDAGKQPQPRQVPTRAHLARRARLSGPKPRFGPGAFVRKGAAAAAAAASAPAGGLFSPLSDDDGDGSGDGSEGGATPAAAPGEQQGSPLIRIPRTLQGGAPGLGPRQHLRDPALMSPGPSGAPAVPQMLREAFLNARLAERWRSGEAWARLDLSGVALDGEGAGREAELAAVVATLTGRQGEAVVAAQLAALEPEWEHLCGVRQRYASSPGGDPGGPAAPKSILKRASGVSPLAAAGERTPPGGAATADANLPGFEEILAAEVVPGSLSPKEWAFAPGLGFPQGGAAGARAAGLDLTPGIATRSRGIKMLASLNGNPGGTSHSPPTGQTDGGQVAGALPDAAAAPQQAQQPGERRRRSEGTRRGGSRGHRLLQALQLAAGPTPAGVPAAAAAAAARLIVDSAGGDLVTGPMATSFVN